MNAKALQVLEFEKILDAVASRASSAPARAKVKAILPLSDTKEINERLAEVEEADKLLYEYAISPSFAFDDISASLNKADVMSVLTMGELLKVAQLLRVASDVRDSIMKPQDDGLARIQNIAATIYTDKRLAEDIDKAIVSDTEMNDNASPELRSIRIRIKKTGESIKAKLYSYVTSPSYSKYIQDNIVTVRGDRYVIPVKAEYRSSIAGLIHDQSASGQTLYIEPMAIVEMNNTLKTYIIDEEREIERILKDFTFRISGSVSLLKRGLDSIVELDVIFAKALYAEATKAKRPAVNSDGIVDIKKGRHPLIAKDKVVPVDIRVGKDFKMLFITGPNTGGKTVSLKLIGLFEAMATAGLFVPAKEATLAVFDDVFCDIGDEQNIEQNLSTFSSHIANIVRITDVLTANSLVLLDELGAGTDPTEGASLAVSISGFINKIGARAVITTHYNELKEYAVVTDGVENASMDFNPLTYSPTYKVIIGTPGASNAILIARKLGLKEEIIQNAQAGIQEGKMQFENVLSSLETARRKAIENEEATRKALQEAEEIKKNAEREKERLFVQREKLNENVKTETKRLVNEAIADANEIVETLKKLLDNPTEQNLFEARKLRKSLTKYIVNEDNEFEGFGEEADGDIRIGDTVLVRPLKVEGVVTDINTVKNTAAVKLGKLNSNFKLDDLLKLKSSKKSANGAKTTIISRASTPLNTEAFNPELNLIGQDSMEASANMDEFMDRAMRAGVHEVRIIHGHGTGKLRDTVRAKLKNNHSVSEYRDGNYYEGNRGATIVTLKNK